MKHITTLVIVTFVLHTVWENAQAPLYAGYQSFSQHFPMCFAGTVGDVVITLAVVTLAHLLKRAVVETSVDFLAFAIIGCTVAIVIEQHALIVGAWHYAPAMPIIPWLRVGLTPILQMTILLPLSLYVTGLVSNKRP